MSLELLQYHSCNGLRNTQCHVHGWNAMGQDGSLFLSARRSDGGLGEWGGGWIWLANESAAWVLLREAGSWAVISSTGAFEDGAGEYALHSDSWGKAVFYSTTTESWQMGSGGMFKRLQPINWKRESTVTDRYIDGEWEFSTKHSSEGVITLENLPITNSYLKNEQIHFDKTTLAFY